MVFISSVYLNNPQTIRRPHFTDSLDFHPVDGNLYLAFKNLNDNKSFQIYYFSILKGDFN